MKLLRWWKHEVKANTRVVNEAMHFISGVYAEWFGQKGVLETRVAEESIRK